MKNVLVLIFCTTLFACKDDDNSVIIHDNQGAMNNANNICDTIELNNRKCYLKETDILNYRFPIDTLFESFFYAQNRLERVNIGFQRIILGTKNIYYDSGNQSYLLTYTDSLYRESRAIGEYFYNEFNRLYKVNIYNRNNSIIKIAKFEYKNCKLSQARIENVRSTSEVYAITESEQGNIVQYELVELNNQAPNVSTREVLEYDSKKNPYQYIPKDEFDLFTYFSNNNITKYKSFKNGVLESEKTVQLTYSAENYPTKTIENESGNLITTMYKYDCY
ncbi:MAG: hypothetical protein ACJAV5_000515 [Vicingaceae bacterium]|jgi:hypothetical protein